MFLHQFQEETGFHSSFLLEMGGSRWPNVLIAKKPNVISNLNARKKIFPLDSKVSSILKMTSLHC